MCIYIDYLRLTESAGDRDGKDEIEILIKSRKHSTYLNCGIFKMDYKNNFYELGIHFPCEQGEEIEIHLVERDLCNDDWKIATFDCEYLPEKDHLYLDIEITPN